jgi:hypothetical protein
MPGKVKVFKNCTPPKHANLYVRNQSQLSFLPRFVALASVVFLLGLTYWYLDPTQIRTSPQIAGTREQVIDLGTGTDDSQTTLENPTPTPKPTKFRPTGLYPDSDCILIFSSNTNLIPVLSKPPQGFWIPENCPTDLKLIQIVRLTSSDLDLINQKIKLENIVLLDDQDTYALVYTQNNQPAPNKLKNFLVPLTQPVFTDRVYFDPSKAYEQRRLDKITYYLNGGCQGGGSPCQLWSMDNLEGTIQLLNPNITQTGMTQTNQLGPGLVLRFAKSQSTDGLNLILVDENDKSYRLLGLDLQNYKIRSSRLIRLTDPEYKTYFR